jgi:hypothetical protein
MSKTSDRYVKVVAWSEEDQCYIGRCPGLMLSGVHGTDEQAVYAELCQVVDEWIELYESEGADTSCANISSRDRSAGVSSRNFESNGCIFD